MLCLFDVCFQLLEYRSTENSAAGRPAGVKGTMARGSRRAITCAGRGACRTSYVCDCIYMLRIVYPRAPPTLPPFYRMSASGSCRVTVELPDMIPYVAESDRVLDFKADPSLE